MPRIVNRWSIAFALLAAMPVAVVIWGRQIDGPYAGVPADRAGPLPVWMTTMSFAAFCLWAGATLLAFVNAIRAALSRRKGRP